MTTERTTPRQIMGTITEDPLLTLRVGAEIAFSSELFTSNAPGGLNDIDNWEFFDGAVIGLLFGDPLSKHILGSGVMVAPGVALAAKHVVEPQMEAVMRGGRGFIRAAILSSGLMIWRPRHVTIVDSTDLALLTLECASPLPEVLRNATISTRPRVGERIFIAGVRHEVEAGSEVADLGVRMMVAAGVILRGNSPQSQLRRSSRQSSFRLQLLEPIERSVGGSGVGDAAEPARPATLPLAAGAGRQPLFRRTLPCGAGRGTGRTYGKSKIPAGGEIHRLVTWPAGPLCRSKVGSTAAATPRWQYRHDGGTPSLLFCRPAVPTFSTACARRGSPDQGQKLQRHASAKRRRGSWTCRSRSSVGRRPCPGDWAACAGR